MNDLSYSISNPKEILHNLVLLWKNKCFLNANFGEHESFITTIVGVDPKKKNLFLDVAPKEYLNKKLLLSADVMFRTEFSGIKAIIPGNKITKTTLSGQQVFKLPIPANMIWRERRQFYRVKSPLSHPAQCQFFLDDENETSVQLNVHDISLSGMALVYDDHDLSEALAPETVFENSKILLPGLGEGHAEGYIGFQIRYETPLNPEKPDKTKKIGCQFTKISPAFESILQRYMQNVERENKKKT